MAWDIYGNPLKRGHCEVHPNVHEEYPCSVCMSERWQAQQPHDALQQLQYEFAQQGDYIKQLEAERNAFAREVDEANEQVAAVTEERDRLAFKLTKIKAAWVAAGCWPDTIEEKQRLGDAINSDPQQQGGAEC